MQEWLEERYKEYLLLDLEKSEVSEELQTEAHCRGGAVYLGIYDVGSRISVFLTASLVVAWLLYFE